MNDYNVSRATQGLVRYLKQVGRRARPGGHEAEADHRLRHAALLARLRGPNVAKVATENGCDVGLFESPRSTPELSFAVRLLRRPGGHRHHRQPQPAAPTDGYKVYFDDGAQIVEPQASGIIAEVNTVTSETYEPLHGLDRGEIMTLGAEIDSAPTSNASRPWCSTRGCSRGCRRRAGSRSSSRPSTARAGSSRRWRWKPSGSNVTVEPHAGAARTGAFPPSSRPTRRTPRRSASGMKLADETRRRRGHGHRPRLPTAWASPCAATTASLPCSPATRSARSWRTTV